MPPLGGGKNIEIISGTIFGNMVISFYEKIKEGDHETNNSPHRDLTNSCLQP